MSKRYLGGGISFEQKDVYQEFSEEESGESSTLAGLTDVDISEPTNGETLVYNATSGKWENGNGGSSSGVTLVEVEFVDNKYVATMTAGAMYAAAQTSVLVLFEEGGGSRSYHMVVNFSLEDGVYHFDSDPGADLALLANSADDYPTG